MIDGPLNIDPATLTPKQRLGLACLQCHTSLIRQPKRWAGSTLDPQCQVYVCADYPHCSPPNGGGHG